MKWYQKTWVIILLLIFFFPAGAFLMWKEKKNWFKPIKIGLSVVLGLWFLLFTVAVFSDTPTETSTANVKKVESKTASVKKTETKTAEKNPSIKLTETSLTIKDNEEKEVKFTLENLKESDVKVVVSDGAIASSEFKDGKCIIKGASKGKTTLQFNSKGVTLAKLDINVEESQETIAKREAEEKAKKEVEERKAQEKAEQERIAQEQAEAERKAQEEAQRVAQEQAAQAEAQRIAQEQAAQNQQNANQTVENLPGNSEMVWKSATGDCYHRINNCGRMNPNKATQMTKEQAESQGLTACPKCY